MSKKIHKVIILFVFACLILMTRCTPKEPDHESIVISTEDLPTPLPSQPTARTIPSREATIEFTPTMTVSHTPIPTMTSMEITPTISVSSTPAATLTFEESRDYIMDQIEDNGNCRLPCVWGLTPGSDRETTEGYFQRFPFMTQGDDFIGFRQYEEFGGVSYFFDNMYGETDLDLEYYLENNMLDQLIFRGQFAAGQNGQYVGVLGHQSLDKLLQYYSLQQILSEYDQPREVYFHAWGLDVMDKSPKETYLIAMYYPDQGFLVQYNGLASQNTGSNLVICPRELSVQLTTWDPDLSPTLEQVTYRGTSITMIGDYLDIFKQINEVTSITEEEFYETYRDPDFTECFETPAELWKP